MIIIIIDEKYIFFKMSNKTVEFYDIYIKIKKNLFTSI